MSDRRHSLNKLSKRLRILEDDLLIFLMKHGVEETVNSSGHKGFDPDIIKQLLGTLSTLSRNEMFLLKVRWEQEMEYRNRHAASDEYFSVEEAADILNIRDEKVTKFLVTHNVPKIVKGGVDFWDSSTILRINKSPSKKQFTELNRLRKNRKQEKHVQGERAAILLGVGIEDVKPFLKQLGLDKEFPLTEETLLDTVSASDFKRKKYRFIGKHYHHKPVTENDDTLSRTVNEIGGIPTDKMFTIPEVAVLLAVSESGLRKLLKNNHIQPDSHYVNYYKQTIQQYSYETVHSLEGMEEVDAMKLRSHRAKERLRKCKDALENQKQSVVNEIGQQVDVRIRDRNKAPYHTTFYVGATNSGKTFNSLNALFAEYDQHVHAGLPFGEETKFVYAGPLRMLAHEVYVKMCERYGEANVGFLTGEEQINPEAPLLAATAEMAPMVGESLVLDESHWIIEPARGHNWTNLLVGGEYKTLHILTAKEALPALTKLVDDSHTIHVREFERKTPILFEGALDPTQLKPKTAVVCFSRKMVYKVAQTLQQTTDLNVGVLYGALPLMVREEQINKFIDNKIDVMVTTDVIGHGINLPLDHVVYAETTKFDGVERRDLHLWEAAQISGRAGRYGLSEKGSVWVMNLGWNDVNRELVSHSAQAAAGHISTNMLVDDALIAPRFPDFHVKKSEHLMLAMEAWEIQAVQKLTGRNIQPATSREPRRLLETIASTLSTPIYPWDKNRDERVYDTGVTGQPKIYPNGKALNDWVIPVENLWQLVSGPFDPNLPTITVVAEWLQDKRVGDDVWVFGEETRLQAESTTSTETLEKLARIVSELKMVAIVFPDTGLDMLMLKRLEKHLSVHIISILAAEITNSTEGFCGECGEDCAPWFRLCDSCHVGRFVKTFK